MGVRLDFKSSSGIACYDKLFENKSLIGILEAKLYGLIDHMSKIMGAIINRN